MVIYSRLNPVIGLEPKLLIIIAAPGNQFSDRRPFW